uniref:Retrovirus-related Pol polyprotein from transposon TNT 1-94 n=1 Tax=Tanacetum cinerariifolium TaxID=118510 RepID=A0A6L2K4T1_TANCI|nr:retrovirus-related Pol polyprotein from transposon TNT 1-94 [Tanacetum cinerariifolium]
MHNNIMVAGSRLQPEWSRFVTIVKQQHKLDEVSYHNLFDILKQYQNEVNELCAEKLARNTNPLALVATAQAKRDPFYQSTRHKGKEIAKPITPPSETAFEKDSDPEQAQRDKDMQKNLALIAKYFKKIYKPTNNNLRTSSNSKNKSVDTTPRVKDSPYHKEKMLLCKQVEQGVALQAEQYDWLSDTNEEVDEQELEAHYNYMANIQEQSESVSNTCSVETNDSNVIPDSPDMCEDDIQNDQNDVEIDDERVILANLIANLKLDTKQTEFEKYKAFNDRTVNYAKLECKINEALGQIAHKDTVIREDLFRAPTALDMELPIQTCLMPLAIKTESDSLKFVHELKQEMHADLKYVESLEKEIDELECKKDEFSDMYDEILQECVSKDVMCSYLMSLSDLDALAELQCMYLHKVKELNCLVQKLSNQTKYVSKEVHSELLQRFAKVEKHSISLEIALQKCKEQKPTVVPIGTRKPKSQANKSIATPNKKKVASIPTSHTPQSYFRVLYENTSREWKWWIERQSPSGYKCFPKPKKQWVPKANMQWIVQLILFNVDSGCTKHMTDNLKLLCNFVEKFLGTVRFGNDQFAPILGYGDLVQGNVTINRVYYVEGLNHNLFSFRQFCDANLEVAFRKSTCFVRDLQGNDLVIGSVKRVSSTWLSHVHPLCRPSYGGEEELRNANHTQTIDLANIYERFVYEDNLIQRRYSDTKKALITTPSSSEEVYDEEEVTQVKVLMALADDELIAGKNHARNDEWVDITMRKVNTLLSMDKVPIVKITSSILTLTSNLSKSND